MLADTQKKIRIAAHIEIAWPDGRFDTATCPNCGVTALAARFIEIDYRPPNAAHDYAVHICPACEARFFDNVETMDYATDELIEIGWHGYQIQLGAGVWPITAPLTRIDKPAGARILEIGGAYGFGLDFGIRARGWQGEGFDPSPLAAFGIRELGLTVVQDYFEEKDLARGPYDVIIATEVIEHVARPPVFLALMRRAVGADGVLLLTTPDAGLVTPDLAAGSLMPMLSPGAHLVLQTALSLDLALRKAGFAHVEVRRTAMSLVAYASPAPLALGGDAAVGRAMFRDYLLARGREADAQSDLKFGFAGRGIFEAVNDGDFAAADAAWAVLVPAARARFGIDLDRMTALPADARGASLARLAQVMPLGLGAILYARGICLTESGPGRAAALPVFRLAGLALDALQSALAQRSLTDAQSARLGDVVQAEIILCLAEAGAAGVVDPLLALTRRDPGFMAVAWRALVGLVNAGAFDDAKAVVKSVGLQAPDASIPQSVRADGLYALAILARRAADEQRERGWHAYQIQLGIGLWPIAAGLLATGKPAGARMLEIGGGYGFGLDFARQALGWTGEGFAPPAPVEFWGAACGLQGDRLAYEGPAGEPFDVVLVADVVEHLLAPAAFLRRLRQATAADGVLLLTTLDAAAATPEVETGRILFPQTAAGLGRLLRDGGFDDVETSQSGTTLVARAGARRLDDGDEWPAVWRRYLVTRGEAADLGSDFRLGFAGRGILEAVNAGDYAAADAAWAVLAAVAQARYGMDLDMIRGLPAAVDDRLGTLADVMPVGLGVILYGRGIRLLAGGAGRAAVLPVFRLALAALDALQAALAALARGDGLAASLRNIVMAEIILCQAEAGDADVAPGLTALLQSDPGLMPVAWQALVRLVNAGALEVAEAARLSLGLTAPGDDLAIDLRRDALFALGMLALRRDDGAAAAAVFGELRDNLMSGGAPGALFWPAVRGEVVALHKLNRSDMVMPLLRETLTIDQDMPEDLQEQLRGPAPAPAEGA